MLTYILLGLGGLILLILLISAFMPKEYSITAEVLIKKPKAEVFDYVVHLKNQHYYSKWVMLDPNAKHTYTGTDGTVGFIAAWESNHKDVGVGAQEIIKIIPGERYDVELRFVKPFKATNYAHTIVTAVNENESKVTTVFEAKTPMPMNLMVPMIKKMLTRDLNLNAQNLKGVLEKK